MSAPAPILTTWDGEAFYPLGPAWARRADKHYVVGERYTIAPVEERSLKSHSHYFAAVNDAWRNLQEEHADRWPTAEHLRKWALIKSGYRDERTHVCDSKAEALRLAAFMKPMDDYAVVVARDNIVVHWTAKSQSMRAMGKKEFQESKDAVLGVLAELLGTTAGELKQNSRDAA